MRRAVPLLFILAIALSACGKTPSEVIQGMTEAAQQDNEEKFLEGFTEESRPFVESMILLGRTYSFLNHDPFTVIGEGEVIGEEINGDEAIVEIKVKRRKRKILMIKEDGDWRIDVFKLEEFWKEKKNFTAK